MLPPVFPFRPNWRRPVLERLEWLTDVMEAKDATEVRIPLRSRPRRIMEFELLVADGALQRLDALLWAHSSEQYVLPIWTDPQPLAATLSAGATAIPAVTAGYDFAPGALAVLWQDADNHEAVEIDAVSADTLTLADPTVLPWPTGTRLLPARRARLPQDVALARVSAAVATGTLRFELDNTPVTPLPDATTYRGAEVALRRPNWISGIQTRYGRKLERIDYDLGAVFVDDLSHLQITQRTHRHLLHDRADIAAFRGWLHARAGRTHAYWQPQWQTDFTSAAAVAASDTSLLVQPIGVAGYAAQPGRLDIAIRHRPTGQWVFRRIDSVTTGASSETLHLNAPIGLDAAARDLSIMWLTLSRLEADAVEIAWHSAGVAATLYDIRSVRT